MKDPDYTSPILLYLGNVLSLTIHPSPTNPRRAKDRAESFLVWYYYAHLLL